VQAVGVFLLVAEIAFGVCVWVAVKYMSWLLLWSKKALAWRAV
jgi:hypothetical protein